MDVNPAHKGGYKSKNNNLFNKTDIFPKYLKGNLSRQSGKASMKTLIACDVES